MNSFSGLQHCPPSELCFIGRSMWSKCLGHDKTKYKIWAKNASSEEIFLLSVFDLAQLRFHPCLCAAGKRRWVKAGWVTATGRSPRIWLLSSEGTADFYLETFWGVGAGFCRRPLVNWIYAKGGARIHKPQWPQDWALHHACSLLCPRVQFLESCWSPEWLWVTPGL